VAMLVFVTWLVLLLALYQLTLWLKLFPPLAGAEKIDPDTTDVAGAPRLGCRLAREVNRPVHIPRVNRSSALACQAAPEAARRADALSRCQCSGI